MKKYTNLIVKLSKHSNNYSNNIDTSQSREVLISTG